VGPDGLDLLPTVARRHLGIYAYRVGALRRLAALAPTPLENVEKLEQLRALAHGLRIQVGEATCRPGPDVNTVEDLARAAAALERSAGTP
jgi:3-deoxy-manno-octulosonate cytidylyltransferase (CMP-KDO synthetase)